MGICGLWKTDTSIICCKQNQSRPHCTVIKTGFSHSQGTERKCENNFRNMHFQALRLQKNVWVMELFIQLLKVMGSMAGTQRTESEQRRGRSWWRNRNIDRHCRTPASHRVRDPNGTAQTEPSFYAVDVKWCSYGLITSTPCVKVVDVSN